MNAHRLIRCSLCWALFFGALVSPEQATAQTYTASPIPAGSYGSYPYNFTGLITTPTGSGSGAVVKNPRVVYSCAHVVFDDEALDPWLSDVRWHRSWSSGSRPSSSNGQLLRSYYYFVGYAAAARIQENSSQSFSLDFVVHYAYENTAGGGFAGWWDDGVSQLMSNRTKLITGYPGGNYQLGDSRKYLMHSTGPFVRPFAVRSGDYLDISEVSTGAGNSGGPAWVSDGSQFAFAGVLVSGLERSVGGSTDSAGVYGVDASSTALIDSAISASGSAVAAPSITSQPTSRRVTAGQSASFTVSALGPALVYRWLFNGAAISGATNATLTFDSVSLTHAGTYQAVVSNAGGEVRSAVATLAVDAGPTAGLSLFASEGTFPARLFRINPSNGAATTVGSVSFFPGLEFRGNGVLYGSSSTLSTISTASGVSTAIGSLPELIVSIAFSPSDELYGVNNGGTTLYKLDPGTGRSLGSVPLTGTTYSSGGAFPGEMGAIDFGPDGKLYGIGFGLYLINPGTGVATRITPSGRNVGGSLELFMGLDFGSDGQLRAASSGTSANLYTINPAAGIGQLVGSMGVQIGGLATQPTGAAGSLPVITTQPSSLAVTAGSTASLTVAATGSPPLTYQWRKDSVAISGATTAMLTVTNAQPSHGGSYTVVVTNVFGSITSNPAVLAVNVLPAITSQPINQTIATGQSVTFSVTATGSPTPVYQWRKDGANIAGATNPALTISNARPLDSGAYSVLISNAAGSVTSTAVTLMVEFSRLINLSLLTSLTTPGDSFTMGYVVGGGTSGAKPLVIRAVGPSLGALGVPGTLDDPRLDLFAGSVKTGENDNWGGGASVANAMAAVGAFAYTGPNSRDAAAVLSVPSGDNSFSVSAVGNGTGAVIAEIYDATPSGGFSGATPRLINVSVLKQLGTGFTVGFVVGGSGTRNVLVRAIGPTLGSAFGLSGAVGDPQLVLRSGQAVVATNDNWGGGTTLGSAFASVGAFALPAASRDAAVSVGLSPGSYTVQVSGVGGATGMILVEIYEAP